MSLLESADVDLAADGGSPKETGADASDSSEEEEVELPENTCPACEQQFGNQDVDAWPTEGAFVAVEYRTTTVTKQTVKEASSVFTLRTLPLALQCQ